MLPPQLTQGIPDRPENKGAIDFLKSAPTKVRLHVFLLCVLHLVCVRSPVVCAFT